MRPTHVSSLFLHPKKRNRLKAPEEQEERDEKQSARGLPQHAHRFVTGGFLSLVQHVPFGGTTSFDRIPSRRSRSEGYHHRHQTHSHATRGNVMRSTVLTWMAVMVFMTAMCARPIMAHLPAASACTDEGQHATLPPPPHATTLWPLYGTNVPADTPSYDQRHFAHPRDSGGHGGHGAPADRTTVFSTDAPHAKVSLDSSAERLSGADSVPLPGAAMVQTLLARNEIVRGALSTAHAIYVHGFRRPLAMFYLYGPGTDRWGMWSGLPLHDICARITGHTTDSSHWYVHREACVQIVERQFNAFMIAIESLILGAIIIYVLVKTGSALLCVPSVVLAAAVSVLRWFGHVLFVRRLACATHCPTCKRPWRCLPHKIDT
jgi:hypothetical protein